MLTSLEEITERIVDRLAPESIILFGSRAVDAESEDSDADLVVVAESSERPIDRRIEKGRYPTEEGLLPHGEPTAQDGERAVAAAAGAYEIVRSLPNP